MTNAMTSELHSAEPTPPATASGTRPIMTLVATTNTTGNSPSTRFRQTSAETRPTPPAGSRAAIRKYPRTISGAPRT